MHNIFFYIIYNILYIYIYICISIIIDLDYFYGIKTIHESYNERKVKLDTDGKYGTSNFVYRHAFCQFVVVIDSWNSLK